VLKTKTPNAVAFVKLSKSSVKQAAEHRFVPCLMGTISNCGNCGCAACGGRRQQCPSDYQICHLEVAAEVTSWAEIEEAGLCLPVRRQVSKKLLARILAVRNARMASQRKVAMGAER
jgi:hypothetical protein